MHTVEAPPMGYVFTTAGWTHCSRVLAHATHDSDAYKSGNHRRIGEVRL